MKKIITMSFQSSLSLETEAPNGNNLTFDVVGVEFYNEFIPCVGGSD